MSEKFSMFSMGAVAERVYCLVPTPEASYQVAALINPFQKNTVYGTNKILTRVIAL